jgi:hypothetical protein
MPSGLLRSLILGEVVVDSDWAEHWTSWCLKVEVGGPLYQDGIMAISRPSPERRQLDADRSIDLVARIDATLSSNSPCIENKSSRQLNLLFRAAKNKRRASGDRQSNRTEIGELKTGLGMPCILLLIPNTASRSINALLYGESWYGRCPVIRLARS